MPLQIRYQDITKTDCDAVVNPTDREYSGRGGADFAIHRATGENLSRACEKLDPLTPGNVNYTEGFGLPNKYVIHTFGPVWKGGGENEELILRSCYTNSLLLAGKLKCGSVAFPLISSGTFGFPKDRVMRIAVDAVSDYLITADNDLDVTICVLDRNAFTLVSEEELESFLSESAGEISSVFPSCSCEQFTGPEREIPLEKRAGSRAKAKRFLKSPESACECSAKPLPDGADGLLSGLSLKDSVQAEEDDLEHWLKMQDDNFAVTLLKLIDKKGMTDVECYKRSNVSRKTFSKINTDGNYRPSKQTVIAFAIGLELSMYETEMLLKTAGFSLSDSYIADRIISFYISHGIYDIFEINSALYKYDQVCLGC